MYKLYVKTALDFVIAFIGFVMLCPLFVMVTVGLFFENHGQPFFFQTRPGKNGGLFKILKFRTMNNKKDAMGALLPDAARLTKLGLFIRKSSLDEIPQLINVLKGDMSLVGPRPLLVEYLPLYSKEQASRHLVKPGITGWAQVNGRNAISWEQKFIFDVWYVENLSFLLDIKILFLTVLKVFMRAGISSADTVTMSKFTGK